MDRFKFCNDLVEQFEKVVNTNQKVVKEKGKTYYTGVDLGTAFIVMAVVDEKGIPVAGRCEFANVVKDGMVVDYIGAVDIVKRMKKELEEILDVELEFASAAIPPGTELVDGGAVKHVLQAANFEVISVLDEPTAANMLINITDGAIVDIGGGTTGISIFEKGKQVYVADEATGGTHLSLVLAGAYKMNFDEAEVYKRNTENHREILPVLLPVLDKIASIIQQEIKNYSVETVYLVGGTACLTQMEAEIEKKLGIPVIKPKNPMFVTPLGIALNCAKSCCEE